MSTAGPAPGVPWLPAATNPAREKMPTPMMPPTPIAVSCHRPSDLKSPLFLLSASMSSMGLRRMMDWDGSFALIRCSSVGAATITAL